MSRCYLRHTLSCRLLRQRHILTQSSTRHLLHSQNKITQPQLYQKPTLPTSNTTTNGSFSNLITQTSANGNTIVQAPLMFVRGGYVSPGGLLDSAGYGGIYWSSVGRSSSRAYNLTFNSGLVTPSNDNYRDGGFSIRCVALGG